MKKINISSIISTDTSIMEIIFLMLVSKKIIRTDYT